MALSSSTISTIQQGVPVVEADAITFLGIGSAGDLDACRILTFPDSLLPPIVYSVAGECFNPERTVNLDNNVLFAPTTSVVKTLGTTRVVRFENAEEDVVVTEIWPGSQTRAAMSTAFFRQLYEYLINAPEFTIGQTDFVTWQPRDRNDKTYNVDIVGLEVGGPPGELDVSDIFGTVSSGTIKRFPDLNTTPTGLVDREVRLRMRIISEV
ncbi:MAG: hypothetical protein GY778_28890 [bacterium]|nr:hypothetical protein [bacterium]